MTPPDTEGRWSGTESAHPGDGNGHEERIEQAARDAASAVRDEAWEGLDRGRQSAAGSAESASHALDRAASVMSEEGQETLAQAASALSARAARLADSLEHRSLDELSREARRLARDNPAMFIAGGLALGLALSRFFKASGARRASASHAGDEYRGYGAAAAGDMPGQDVGNASASSPFTTTASEDSLGSRS